MLHTERVLLLFWQSTGIFLCSECTLFAYQHNLFHLHVWRQLLFKSREGLYSVVIYLLFLVHQVHQLREIASNLSQLLLVVLTEYLLCTFNVGWWEVLIVKSYLCETCFIDFIWLEPIFRVMLLDGWCILLHCLVDSLLHYRFWFDCFCVKSYQQ